MINAEKIKKKTEMLMTKKAVKTAVKKMKKKKKIKKKTEKHMYADNACRMMMMTMTIYNDTETSISIMTS